MSPVPSWSELSGQAHRAGFEAAAAGVVEFQGEALLLRRAGRWGLPTLTAGKAGSAEGVEALLLRAVEQQTGLEVGGLSYYLGSFDSADASGGVPTRTFAFTFWFEHQKWGVPPLWSLNPGDRWQDTARVTLDGYDAYQWFSTGALPEAMNLGLRAVLLDAFPAPPGAVVPAFVEPIGAIDEVSEVMAIDHSHFRVEVEREGVTEPDDAGSPVVPMGDRVASQGLVVAVPSRIQSHQVPVRLTLWPAEPPEVPVGWDHLGDAELRLKAGDVLHVMTTMSDEGCRIGLPPRSGGRYQVQVWRLSSEEDGRPVEQFDVRVWRDPATRG